MAKRLSGVNRLADEARPFQCKCMGSNDKSREERLAKALRENLKRRKAQTRQLDEKARDPIPADGAGSPSRR